MVRPLGEVNKNVLKVKALRGNAIGLNMTRIQQILTEQHKSTRQTLDSSSWRSISRRASVCPHHLIMGSSVEVLSSDEETESRDEMTQSLMNSKPEDLSSLDDTVPDEDHGKRNSKNFIAKFLDKGIQRKYRMKDKFGNPVLRVRKNNRKTIKATAPKLPQRNDAEISNTITLNIRCLKLGTLNKIFKNSDTLNGKCRFAVDYIEIANTVRIEASELTSCEWCTARILPSLFLQTTPAACIRLRVQLNMYDEHARVWYDCQSKNQDEKYLVLIFENELTLMEKNTLEEILTQIGRNNNICSFPVKLLYEEANNRLVMNNRVQKQEIAAFQPLEDELPDMCQGLVSVFSSPASTRCEIATFSVSDSDEDNLIELPSSPKQDIKKLVVYPPPPAKGGITITEDDLKCLKEGEFLNDVIIDFYLKYLVNRQQEMETTTKFHVFSSFFFKHLTQDSPKSPQSTAGLSVQEHRHNRVKTWTRHVNIFEKDFIFVPINQSAHWYLAVICFPGQVSRTSGLDLCVNWQRHSVEDLSNQSPPNPMSLFYCQERSEQPSRWSEYIDDTDLFYCNFDDEAEDGVQKAVRNRPFLDEINYSKRPCILIMDSLGCKSRSSVVQILQEYLQEEWRVRMGHQQSFGKGLMEGWSPLVPNQDNFTDCGIYLLQYVESFLKDPPQVFQPSMDLSDWFSQRTVKKKRAQIKKLILRLHREQTS